MPDNTIIESRNVIFDETSPGATQPEVVIMSNQPTTSSATKR
jgi:hypothetical protein